ncbi:hypothetical protein ESCNG_200006 [Neisseria gonorrhoeae]|nr:hypothetical protein ESCNG_200006 [Neisseria gonorrhoeae]
MQPFDRVQYIRSKDCSYNAW